MATGGNINNSDIQVQKIRLVATVERLNRSAVAAGQNGRIKAAKGVIQLKKVGENHWQLWVSVAKDIDGQRYDVLNVSKMRTNFIKEGKLSIELRQPPFTLMIRDCANPAELELFVSKIQEILRGGPRIKPLENANVASTSSGQSEVNDALTPAALQEAESRRPKSIPGLKRSFAQMDMSKSEAASIRKSLKMSSGVLVIADRSEYPLRGFPTDLKRLVMPKLMLKKIDYRIQDLLHLKILSMPENRISSIDALAFLKCRLEHLNMAGNQIENISENLFLSKAFSGLKVLNLNDNKLRTLPHAFVELTELKEFQVANNYLQVLPYNLHRLRSLVSLRVNNNRLSCLPSPISLLNLNHLDISANLLNGADQSLRRVRKKVALSAPESPPTLFELAGSAVLTAAAQKRTRYLTSLSDPALLPRFIFDYLLTSKYCRSCGKMFLRYQISYQSGSQPLAQEFVRNFREYSICMISCEQCCSQREF